MTPGDLASGAQLPGQQGSRAIDAGRPPDGTRSRCTRSPRPATTRTKRPHLERHDHESARSALPALPVVRERPELGRRAGQGRRGTGRRQQPRHRRRLREGHERQPLVHANRRPCSAVLRRQQQAHGRRVRREHAEAAAADARCVALGGRFDRITTETVDTPLKTNFTPSESTLHRLQPKPRDQARAGREPPRALRDRPRVHSRRSADADRLHDDHRRRPHADHPGQSGPEAGTQHVVRRRRRVDVARDSFRRHGVPDGRQGPVHLERRHQQSAAARSDRRVGRATGSTRTSAAWTSRWSGGSAAASACSRTPRTTSTARSGWPPARSRTS